MHAARCFAQLTAIDATMPGNNAARTMTFVCCMSAGNLGVNALWLLVVNVLLCFLLQVRQWNIWGLPKDDFSTENAIAIDAGEQRTGTGFCCLMCI